MYEKLASLWQDNWVNASPKQKQYVPSDSGPRRDKSQTGNKVLGAQNAGDLQGQSIESRMLCGKRINWWKECDAVDSDLLGKPGCNHLCGDQFDMCHPLKQCCEPGTPLVCTKYCFRTEWRMVRVKVSDFYMYVLLCIHSERSVHVSAGFI